MDEVIEVTGEKKPGKTVLVVDDSLLFLKKVGAVLQQMGCRVLLADSGDLAIKQTKEHRPDLIILDVMMPEKDGIETLKELRSDLNLRETPVVMLTSSADGPTVSQALSAHVKDYILKSNPPADLLMRLRRQVEALDT